MIIDFHKSFQKQAAILKPAQKKRLKEALLLFADDPYNSLLYNHSLSGEWKGFRSISIGEDCRALYKVIDEKTAFFVAVGTHNQLYK